MTTAPLPDDAAPLGDSPTRGATESVLSGGGEMGALMRSLDWAKTPVGPVETWPQSLRTVLSILLGAKHPMMVWWGKDLVQFYNDGYRPIMGSLKHPAAMGQRGFDCWKEVWSVIAPLIDKVFAGGATFTEDGLFLINRHGFLEETHFNYAYSPIRNEAGVVAGVLVAGSETTGRVISERRLALQRELSMRFQLARNVEAVFRSVEEVLGQATADLSFTLLYEVSGATARLVSCAGLERGTPAAPSEVKLDDDQRWPLGAAVSSGQELVVDDLEHRFGVLTCEASAAPVSRALVLPLIGIDGQSIGVLVAGLSPRLRLSDEYRNFIQLLARQITATISLTHASEQQKQRAAQLAEFDRAKTAFFSNVSHEFRTPLTLILGPVKDALSQPQQALSGEGLELVRRNAQRLQKLVNSLLDFSRVEAARADANPQLTDVCAFTIDLVSAFRSLVEKAGLTLTVECPPSIPEVYVDREMYEKIVLNLLSNAFKFTFTGEIRVGLEAVHGQVQLTVADTGIGIAEAALPRLFERFHRVEGAKGRSAEGSGIGLALVHELAQLHGGSVRAQSRLGEGTCFTVLLPLGKAQLPVDRSEVDAALDPHVPAATPFVDEASSWVRQVPRLLATFNSPLPTKNPFSRLEGHVLLADDNADMRGYLQRLLTEQGLEVEMVSDGQSALAAARARVPDLVLSDVMMPGLDGFGLLQALRQNETTRDVPVILLSARSGEEASLEGLSRGADDYLAKPFSARELVARVAARLEISRARADSLVREKAIRTEVATEREKLLRLFMEAPIGICILEGPEHTFTLANPTYRARIAGREVLGRRLLEVFPEAAGLGFDAIVDQVMLTGEPVVGNEAPTNWDRSGTGRVEQVFYNFVCAPKTNAQGKVDGVVVCAFEVTDQVLARRRVEALAQELKLADRRKDEFLAMLAHELRNPMAAITMALSMLELNQGDGEGEGAQRARYRSLASRQMTNLVRMVDELLDVSRITRGQVELRLEEVDLPSILQSALSVTRPNIEARRQELTVTTVGTLALNADPTRLEQVVVNLLNNASKYTSPGGAIQVSLAREQRDGQTHVVLRVRDNGRGIPQDMLEKVFDAFVQISPTLERTIGGLGLGLTVVKNLVELHGGTVWAHSEGWDKGSEFVVRLPFVEALEPLSQFVPDVPAAPRSTASEPRRVLVVEDSPDVCEGLTAVLTSLGHQVEIARDGLEGLARILELRPDVSLVDVGLPGIDGHEVARRVRASPGGADLYLVALSGYGGAEAKASAKEAGFDLHVTKPAKMGELQGVVSRRR